MVRHADQTDDRRPSPARTWALRALASLAVTIAALSIATSISGQWQQILRSAFAVSIQGVAILIAGITGTLVLSALYHTLLLPGFQAHQARPAQVAYAYSLSQLLRYVPGKVVGIVFHVSMLRGSVRPSSVISALAVHTVHDYAWTFTFCGIILWGVLSASMWPLLLFLPVLVAVHYAHELRLSQRLLAKLPFLGRYVPYESGCAASDWYDSGALTLTLAGVWIPMVGGMWIAFSPLLGSDYSLTAALLYLVAAAVSLAMIVVPSGLVVREAVFLWLGGLISMPADQLLFVAVVMRITMTLAEVLATLLLMVMDLRSRHAHRT